MGVLQHSWILLASFILCMVDSRGIAGNVKLVAMNGNQYWFSTSSPYAPTLNFHLAYQYCRTLGLQLAVLETTEEVETISAYLNKDTNPMNHNKYWTSGNRLGAESWIWMSSGDQMNSSFADYWLKNGVGVGATDNPRHCMSMKPPISPTTKRAIFQAEECQKSFPFICEQVRCLYYNYPVMMFPDPSELRAETLEDGTSASPAESESRTSVNFSTSEKIRIQNLISGDRKNKQLSVADIVAAESGRIDPSKIQPRMILRPVMSTYPMPSYVSSFHKYKATEYTPPTNTKKSPFKKSSNENLWTPSLDDNRINTESTTQQTPQITTFLSNFNKKHGITRSTMKPTTFITGKIPKSSNTTTVTSKPYPHAVNIVTSKTTTINGKELTEDELDYTEDEDTAATMLYHRYGSGTNPTDRDHIFASGYVSTDSSVFDDEKNNVGSEVEDTTTIPKFFQGSGIRHPDMTNDHTTSVAKFEEVTTVFPFSRQNASYSFFPISTTKQFQKSKSQISWSNKAKTSAAIIPNTNTGQETMGLGSRLKLRLKSN